MYHDWRTFLLFHRDSNHSTDLFKIKKLSTKFNSLCVSLKGNCHKEFAVFRSTYRKIPIISPGLIFVQKAFLLGLFSGELIFGGA